MSYPPLHVLFFLHAWVGLDALSYRYRYLSRSVSTQIRPAAIQSEDDALAFVGEFRRRRDTGADNTWIVKPIGELAPDPPPPPNKGKKGPTGNESTAPALLTPTRPLSLLPCQERSTFYFLFLFLVLLADPGRLKKLCYASEGGGFLTF